MPRLRENLPVAASRKGLTLTGSIVANQPDAHTAIDAGAAIDLYRLWVQGGGAICAFRGAIL